jgi:hypothetical protein
MRRGAVGHCMVKTGQMALALAAFSAGCGSSDGAGGTPRAVHGINARSELISGGSVMLLLGNPLSSSGQDDSMTSLLFYDPEAPPGECRDQLLDGCRVSVCDGVDMNLSGKLLSAGSVTLSTATGNVTLTRTSENRYSSAGEWQSGDRVGISATGADVPSFESEIQIPERLVVLAPVFLQNNDFDLNPGAPLELSWAGAGSASVKVVLMQAGLTANPVNIVCEFPAADARATVSPRVLARLSRNATVQVTISAAHSRSEQAGELPVQVEGVSFPFFGRATLR